TGSGGMPEEPGVGGHSTGGMGGAVEGGVLWYRYFDRTPRIEVDSAGELIVVDSAAPETDFGCGPMSAPASNPFVLSLDPASGDCLWSYLTQSPLAGSANAMALAEPGRIIIGGSFKGDTFDL